MKIESTPPTYLAIITYEKRDKDHSPTGTRCLFGYNEKQFEAEMSAAWEPRATALVFKLECLEKKKYRALERSGLWG